MQKMFKAISKQNYQKKWVFKIIQQIVKNVNRQFGEECPKSLDLNGG